MTVEYITDFRMAAYRVPFVIIGLLVKLLVAEQCRIENTVELVCNQIPKIVTQNASVVRIEEFLTSDYFEVQTSNFEHSSWKNVTSLVFIDSTESRHYTYIKFTAECFSNLKSLRKVKIQIKDPFEMDPDMFVGLHGVTELDMSSCGHLQLQTVFKALNSKNKLLGLEKLILSRVSYKEAALELDITNISNVPTEAYKVFSSKPALKVLEITGTELKRIRPTIPYMPSLEVINMSYSHFGELLARDLPSLNNLKHVKSLDFSYISLPLLEDPTLYVLKMTGLAITCNNTDIRANIAAQTAFAPQSVNISGMVPKGITIMVKSCAITFVEDMGIYTHEILLKENGLKYLDLQTNCGNFSVNSLTSIHMSKNGLQFLHPSILQCVPNLKYLDLSENELNVMSSVDFKLFESLFNGVANLRHLRLSENGLRKLPYYFFSQTTYLETLDLSNNQLTQVTFDVSHLENLQQLLLKNNKITFLDAKSLRLLDHLPALSVPNDNRTTLPIEFEGNPLSCKACETKAFWQWMLQQSLSGGDNQTLQCRSEEDLVINVNDSIQDEIENICIKKIATLSIAVVAGIFIVVLLISLFITYKRRKRLQRMQKYTNALRFIRQGRNQYEFAAFLSYSSMDDEFVRTEVLGQLEDNLQKATGVKRTLVCIGDLNLRPGFLVLDETIHCMNRSATVIIVVSDDFCRSNYCHNELYQAYHMKKPILLILKGKVDEDLMTPVMKLLFKQTVRIIFEGQGDLTLKGTWPHVCKSIIDLISEQH